MLQVDDIEFLNFTDPFMSGVEGKRIKLHPENLEQFHDTIQKMFQVIAASEGQTALANEKQISEDRKAAENMEINAKKRELTALDMEEDVLNNVEITTGKLVDTERLMKVASKLLSLTPDVAVSITKDAIEKEKLNAWNEKSKEEGVIPIQKEVSKETVQAAIDEVQNAFDTVLEKAKEKHEQQEWNEDAVAALFGGSSPVIEPIGTEEDEYEEIPKKPEPIRVKAEKYPKQPFTANIEEKVNQKLDEKIDEKENSFEVSPTMSRFSNDEPYYGSRRTRYIEPTYKEMGRISSKNNDVDEFFGVLPPGIAQRLKVDPDIVKVLKDLEREQEKTADLSSTNQELMSRRDDEEKKAADSEREKRDAEASKADAAEEAALHAKKTVMEAIKARIQSVSDRNIEIQQENEQIVEETAELKARVAQNKSTAMQLDAEANQIRSKINQLDLTDLIDSIIPQEVSPREQLRRRGR